MKSGKNSDHGPYTPKGGKTEGGVHSGAGDVGKDYGIKNNEGVAGKVRGGSSK